MGGTKVGTPTVTLRLAGGISIGSDDDADGICGLDRFPKDNGTPPSSMSQASADASAPGVVMKRARY